MRSIALATLSLALVGCGGAASKRPGEPTAIISSVRFTLSSRLPERPDRIVVYVDGQARWKGDAPAMGGQVSFDLAVDTGVAHSLEVWAFTKTNVSKVRSRLPPGVRIVPITVHPDALAGIDIDVDVPPARLVEVYEADDRPLSERPALRVRSKDTLPPSK